MSKSLGLLASTALALAIQPITVGVAYAQTAQEGEIVVTGSYIRRSDFSSPSPIEVIDASELAAEGATQVTDIIRNLTANAGARTSFDQSNNARGGVSSFNLRGLGTSSTLTLFNGRRVAPRATNANMFPMGAIGRVEVLKDGASALYGADAVGGVVNLISRDVDGFELDYQYQTTTDLGDETEDTTYSGAWGASNDSTRLNAFFTYMRRSGSHRADPFVETSSGRTIAGFPGTLIPLADVTTGPYAGTLANTRLVDPECGNPAIGNTFILASASGPSCMAPYIDYLSFVSEYDSLSTLVTAEHDVNSRFTIRGEFVFSDITDRPREFINHTTAQTGIVPASHPDNPFGVNVRYIGAPGTVAPGFRNMTTQTFRASPSIEYEIFDRWFLDVGYNYFLERQSNVQRAQNVSRQRLQDALNGVGGPNRNERFNPFGTALTDPTRANSQALIDFITPEQIQLTETYYETFDAVLSGQAFALPGGPAGFAFGLQTRRERFEQDLDPFILGYANDRPSVSVQPVRQVQSVEAVFAEASLPLLSTLEASVAVRHEDYGAGIGDTQDPKVAVRWAPADWLTLRASYGTSFRAPNPSQLDTGVTSRSNLPFINPRSGPNCSGTGSGFANAVFTGNANLRPETSTNYNLGAQTRIGSFRAGIDYYNFTFEDQVARSSGQAIILADCIANSGGPPTDPRIEVDALGNISTVAVTLDNLSTIETDGVEFTVGYTFDLGGAGELDISNTTTWMLSYDIQNTPGGAVIDGLGSRNLLSNRVSTPEIRSNTTLSWMLSDHTITAVARYVSEYEEDLNTTTRRNLDAYVTLDLQYAYQLPSVLGLESGPSIAIGGINIFNERPPLVNETWGFDTSVADGRGRMVYLRLSQRM